MTYWKFLKQWDITEGSWCLRLYSLVLVIRKRLNSLAAQDTSFSTSASLGYYPLLLVVKKTFWGRGSCVISYEYIYMYLKVGTTHFYHLALYNLVLGLREILLKSKMLKWWMSHGDMTMYSHATILGVLLGQLRQLFMYIKTLCSYVSYIDFIWTTRFLPPFSGLIGI